MISHFVWLRAASAALRLVVLGDVHILPCLVWKFGKVIGSEGSKYDGGTKWSWTISRIILSEAVPQVAHGKLS